MFFKQEFLDLQPTPGRARTSDGPGRGKRSGEAHQAGQITRRHDAPSAGCAPTTILAVSSIA